VSRALCYDTVLRVTRYVAIRAPGLTILLSLPNYYITTYCMMLGYTTVEYVEIDYKLTLRGLVYTEHQEW
jgi:hypothetical protein